MRFFISGRRQQDILEHVFTAENLSEARELFKEASLAAYYGAGSRAIKDERKEINANNPNNPFISALSLRKKQVLPAAEKNFTKWKKEKHVFILVPKDLDTVRTQSNEALLVKRILIAQYTAMKSGKGSFKNADYVEAASRLSVSSEIKERSVQTYLNESVKSGILSRTEEKRPSYSINIPLPHVYTASEALYSFWSEKTLHDVAGSRKLQAALKWLDFYYADNPDNPQELAVPNMPYYFYLKSYPLEKYFGLLEKLKELDAKNNALQIDCFNKTVIFHLITLVFSKERNELFLCGLQEKDGQAFTESIISAERIKEIALHKVSGEAASNKGSQISSLDISIFEQTLDEMISISENESFSTDAINTLVRIEPKDASSDGQHDFGFAGKILRNIKNHRPNTAIIKEEKETGCLLYYDRIRGEDDFRRIVRAFGDRCTILAPESLRQKMLKTQRGVLELYDDRYPDPPDYWYARAEKDYLDGPEISIRSDKRNIHEEKRLLSKGQEK